MDRVKVQELLDNMGKYVPVYKIEAYLKMPTNTLQKALSETEERGLPKKWIKPLTDFVNFKQYLTMGKVTILDVADEPKQEKQDKKEQESAFSSFGDYRRKKLGL